MLTPSENRSHCSIHSLGLCETGFVLPRRRLNECVVLVSHIFAWSESLKCAV